MPSKNPKSDPTLVHFINNLRLVLNMDEIPGTAKEKEPARKHGPTVSSFVGQYTLSSSHGMNGMRSKVGGGW